MNLTEAINLVKNKREQMQSLGVSLDDAKEARDELTRQLSNARARLKRKRENTKYPTKLAEGFITSMKKSGTLANTLKRFIDEAAEINVEFERSAYKAALYKVADDPDIYKLLTSGIGWEIRLTPEIVFEESAGDLEDWASAIEDYRDDLEVQVKSNKSKAGEKATLFWANRVFGTGLEVITINARLGYATGLAPFWRILNSGSQPLASDRPDNSFNPIPASPTDFLGDAERAIASDFRELMLSQREAWFDEAKLLEEEINEASEIRNAFSSELEKLSTDNRKNRSILDRLFKRSEYVKDKNLPNAVTRYRADEKSENPPPEATDVGIFSKTRRFLVGLYKKYIRGVEGNDD